MEIPSGVGQVEVEITYVYGGFPSRQIECLASQFGLIHRIRGDNDENLEYIKNIAGVRLHVQEVAGNDGVKIQMQHPSIDGMKQGFECLEGLLEQNCLFQASVTSDFDAMRDGNGLSDLEWKLRYGMKSCLCPQCGRMKIHLKDLEQHYNQQHVSEKYDMMMIKISGASAGVRRSVVENALGEFGSISYIDMEAHPRDIYVKFVRPVAVEKALAYKRGKLMIDGKQVQLTRLKIGEVDSLLEELIRKRKESDYSSSVETGVFLPYQTGKEWAVDKFVEKDAVQNFHPTRIYVRGFRKETDRRQLKDFFDQFGRVEEVRIKDPGQTKAYGFVEFRTKKALEKILGDRDVSYLPLEGSQLTVKRVAVNRSDDQLPDMSDIQPETVRQIYVEGFPTTYDQKDLVSFFKVYGDIKKCTLVKASGDKPRHALVTFSNMTSVEELQKEMVESGGLYIRGIALIIERTSDQIEKAIRKRTEERKRKLEMGQRELDYFKKTPAIEHKAGVAKPGLPLMEIKQKLDQVAKQISSYGTQELSADKFWSLRNQWEWLNTTKAELTKEAERELFSIPRSDGLDASTMAAAASKLQEALEKLVDAFGRGKTTDVSSKMNPAVSGSLYKNLPSGTKLTGTDWRGRSQSAANDGSNRIPTSTNVSFSPPGFWSPPVLKGIGYSAPNTYFQEQSYGAQSQLSYFESLSTKGKAFSDNLQAVDMDVSDDEDKKQTGWKTSWSTSPGKNTSWDPYRISVLGFTPLVLAKDLQKMFTCHGLAREVRIYLEHDIRYAFMTFPKQKTVKNLFKGKLGVNLQMKDMKLICNRIQESKTPGPTARLLSELVEEPPEKSAAKSLPAASFDAIPLVLPIPNEQFIVLQLLANVEDLVSPPRAKPLTEAEMLEDLQEREVRMVHSLQYQLGHENPERVVRIIKHLRCIHSDITIQRILFHLNKEELQAILYSTSKPELVKAVQKYVPEIENAKSDTTEINLYHLIRKMVVVINDVVIKKSPAYRDMYDVTTPGISESHPIVISDMPDAKTPPKERTSRWGPDRGTPSFASQVKNITGGGWTGGFVKKMTIEEKRKGLQKLLGELPSDKRQKVEDIFRKEVNERRNKGESVDEQEEINIYITALGEISKRKVTKESDGKDTRRDEKPQKEKQYQTSSEKRSSKDQSKQTGKEKINSSKKRTEVETRSKGKSSCNGKISLEGLSMAEKRLRVQKALDEIPPFVSSKVKSRQKLALTKMKSEGKQVGEEEELDSLAEAFNHMFNEEGNIMAHVLRDQIFKQKGDYRLKRDYSLKQLHLPQFDEQVKKFRNFDQKKQAEEMKALRESLSVLLKILLFKRQDKVFEDAEKSGIVLSKLEKNIVRYQILLDMTQAVVTKREEKEKGTTDITAGAYHAEKEESGDEFDDDGNSHLGDSKKEKEAADSKETKSKGQKRPLEEPSHKTGGEKKGKLSADTSMVIENGDDDDDVIIIEDPEEVTTEEKDEVEKILNEMSSDEDVDVDVEEYDETKLLEDIEGNGNQEIKTQDNVCISIENNEESSDIGGQKTVTKDVQTVPEKELSAGKASGDLLEIRTDKGSNEETNAIEDGTKTEFRENIPDASEAEKGNEEETTQEITESKEERQARLETAFREVLTPAQRRTILGRMTKAKKAQQAAGNELSDEETITLRYRMITEMLEKQQSGDSGSKVTTTSSQADTTRVSEEKEADKDD